MKRIRRSRFGHIFLIVATVLLGMIAASPAASADGRQDEGRHEEHFESSIRLPRMAIASEQAARSGLPAANPPSGGCEGEVGFNVTAYYQEAYLVETTTPYTGTVRCTTTGDDQFMAHISLQTSLLIDGQSKWDADDDQCNDCNYAWAGSTAYCIQGPQKCYGTYTAKIWVTMLLPDGWYWTGSPWYGCALLGGEYPPEAYCEVESTPAEIPYVY